MNNFADQLIMGQDSAFYEKVRGYMEDSGMSASAVTLTWKDSRDAKSLHRLKVSFTRPGSI